MVLFTKEIEQQLQAQYPLGSSLDQMVVCKIFNPYGSGTWYVMNQDPEMIPTISGALWTCLKWRWAVS